MQEQKSIKDLTEIELKAIAYDELAKLEVAQNNLKIINNELASRAEKTQTKSIMEDENITPTVEEIATGGEENKDTQEETITENTGTEVA